MRLPLVVLVALGCTGSRQPTDPPHVGDGKADAPATTGPIRFVDADLAELARAANCAAGNGEHRSGTFTPGTPEAEPAAMLVAIKAEDARIGCPGRVYSRSKASAAATLRSFVANDESFFEQLGECEADGESPDFIREELLRVAEDPGNLAVFSSTFDPASDDEPTACNYHRFYVMRKTGTAIALMFDYSD